MILILTTGIQVVACCVEANAGFVIYWMLSFVSMIALGVPVENINNAFGMRECEISERRRTVDTTVSHFLGNLECLCRILS